MESLLAYDRAVLFLCIAGLSVSTLEFLSIAANFGSSGVYSWRILQLRPSVPRGARLGPLVDALFDEQGMRALLVVRLTALTLTVVAPLGSWLFSLAIALLVANTFVFTWRREYGDDGSDQMSTIVLVTLLLTVGPHSTPFLAGAGLVFIAAQACLSYAAAGLAKLVSPTWRSGEAIYRIFNTATYGMEPVARFLEHRRWLNVALCWSVILIESLFPLCLLLPAPWSWLFLAWGFAFHLQCAAIMGLNSFLWAFVATYPAILYTSGLARSALGWS